MHRWLVLVMALAVTGCTGSSATPPATAEPTASGSPSAIPSPSPSPSPTPSASPTPQRMFALTGSMSVSRSGSAGTPLSDGRMLVTGGQTKDGSSVAGLATTEIYDPNSGIFEVSGPMRSGRLGHTATLLPDGRVLVVGGLSDVSSIAILASAEIYDPSTDRFSPTGSLRTARFGHTATLLQNGKVLIAGGFDRDLKRIRAAELYDPGTGKFSTAGAMKVGRGFHAATLLDDGRVLFEGGYWEIASDRPNNVPAELYDPQTRAFATVGGKQSIRSGHTATLLSDGRVLIAGGAVYLYGASPNPLDADLLFDPKTDSFTTLDLWPYAFSAAVRLVDGRVLLCGGKDQSGSPTDRASIWDPNDGSLTAVSSLTVPRVGPAAFGLPDGRVIIVGGHASSGESLASAELY
jgi:hypothetical protein